MPNNFPNAFAPTAARMTKETLRTSFDPDVGRRHPLHILLAEDSAVNQKVALRILERLGYRADLAATGVEAVAALQRQPYDVILMDVQMPQMDGLEATRQIRRAQPAAAGPRIIAMTANATQADRQACFEAGMDDYVSKPIRVEELAAALLRVPVAKTSLPVTAESVLDRAALARLAATPGDAAFVSSLIGVYLQDAPALLAAAERAVTTRDIEGLRLATHGLESNSAELGATTLSELCRQLEDLARTGRLEEAHTLLAQARLQFERVQAALMFELEKLEHDLQQQQRKEP